MFALSSVCMHRLSTFVSTLVVALATIATSSCSSPTAPVDTTVTLAPGQTATVGTLSVKFIEVTHESRCPINALCIHPGDVHVSLEALALTTRRSFELKMFEPADRSVEVRGYTVELKDVTPYPFLPQVIDPADYRVTLEVRRD